MKPTEQFANPASTAKAGGLFAMLCALCAVAGLLASTAAPALAASPETPRLTLVSHTVTTASLAGVLNPAAAGEPGTYELLYRLSGSECEGESVGPQGLTFGFIGEPVFEELTALQPSAQYTVCLLARNEAGETALSAPLSFETEPAPPEVLAESGHATSVTATSANLEATINPENQETKYFFEYATTEAAVGTAGATKVPATPGTLPAAFAGEPVTVASEVLAPGTTYYYRVVAENVAHEKSEGAVASFTTVPTPSTDPVSAIAASTATFHGHLTLDPVAAQYSFNYKIGTECAGESATPAGEAGSGTGNVSEATPVTGLEPDTLYAVCFVTSNAFGSQQAAPVTFRTLPETSVTEVTSSGATLHAVLDPEGGSTSYHFQYGPIPAYGSQTPEAKIEARGPVPVEFHVQGLSVATPYHFRVIATNRAHETSESADHTFTTQPAGTEFALPDDRAWELVSPTNKHGAGIEAMPGEGGLSQAAEAGGAITYVANDPIETEPRGNRSLEYTQVLSTRGTEGWHSKDIATPHTDLGQLSSGHELAEYKFFSSDLSLGLVEPKGATPLPPLEAGAEKTIYLRHNSECEPTSTEAVPAGCYQALVTAANVPEGTKFGGHEVARGVFDDTVEFDGATPDLSHVVLNSPEALTSETVAGEENLYEWVGGRLQSVNLLPRTKEEEEKGEKEQPTTEVPTLGYGGSEGDLNRHAISDEGSRVIWQAGNSLGVRHIYLRDMETKETIQLDVPEEGVEGGYDKLRFQTASSDGSRIFFTDEQQLTAGSHAEFEKPDLYVFEVTSSTGEPLAGKLTDLTVDPNTGESADVQYLIPGASEDGSYVYFVANGVLSEAENGEGESAKPGEPHLYMEHYDSETSDWEAPRFIATLSEEDEPDWGEENASAGDLGDLAARVSPDGRYLAFMSQRSLTGYDNTDVTSSAACGVEHGICDEEVYLYDAAVGPAGRLVCASCDPTGARPAGVLDHATEEGAEGLLVDRPGVWHGRWLAGSIPGWTPVSSQRASYQSRYLSNSGRLFFESPDALVPGDVNGVEDVYEYEPEGVGPAGARCSSSSEGASDVFSREAGGCVGLISSGTSSLESVFLDASGVGPGGEEAEEVFFLTAAQLVPEDVDSAYDVYDAHVCSVVLPCPASANAVPPACENEASCKPPPESQPSIYGLPASATFSGESNFAPIPPAVVKKAAAKKTVKCKRGYVKKKVKKKEACVKKPKKKAKAKKSVRADRRASR